MVSIWSKSVSYEIIYKAGYCKLVDLLFNKYELLSFMSNESESKKILNPSSCTNISAKLLGFF